MYQRQPFTTHTRAGLGSLTKQFTATAILQLVEAGNIELDRPLSDYLHDYKFSNQITIRQLLNMDSGIPDYTDLVSAQLETTAKSSILSEAETEVMIRKALGRDIPFEQILNTINAQPLDFKPGSQFAYSNTNYAILSTIIERITNMSYASYIQKHILNPLSMSDTKIGTETSSADSYTYQDNVPVNLGKGNHQLGDGCMVTNLIDFKKWATAVMAGKLLTPANWQMCFDLQHGKYGIGWMKINSWYWHSGEILGYWSDFFMSPNRDLAMVWLYNVSPAGDETDVWLEATDDWRERFLQTFEKTIFDERR